MTAPARPVSVLHSSVDDVEITTRLDHSHPAPAVLLGLRSTVGDVWVGSEAVTAMSLDDYERLCRRGLALVALARDATTSFGLA